ncbi:MAG: thioesterase [Eubacteriales bacterium]|nr:thioesterase [Eubacteriales bacterium]
MPYQFGGRIRYSEVDERRHLTLPGIVDYFQDCSTFQSEKLGVGLDEMQKRKRAWILAYWEIEVRRFPVLGEEITTETWPCAFGGFMGQRNFRMKDENGETLACANSIWVFMDTERGKIAKIDQDILNAYVMEDALPMGNAGRKVMVPQESEDQESFVVMRCHLDTNHHVNNGQYILMAEEYLPEYFEVKRVRAEYRKSAVLHDIIVPVAAVTDSKCTVALCDTDHKPYAIIEFSGEQRTK